jgi:predicted transcriptional regulator of viral defense system
LVVKGKAKGRYFASQRQGVHLLDADFATDLVGISRKHAVNLLASMAQKGALHRVGRGRYVVIPPWRSWPARN